MGKKSLDKLLVNGEEIDVVVRRGSTVDQKYTNEARKIADFMINKLGLSFGNVEFRIIGNEEFAERIALYINPLPSWEAGQSKLLQEDIMKYRQGTLYEAVGHKFFTPFNNKEYTVVYINENNTYEEVLSVIAHVYGHLHVMYNNKLESMVNMDLNSHQYYRERYRQMERILGVKTVENLYDYAQTLSGLIDMFPDFHPSNNKDYYSTDRSFPKEDVYDVYKFTLENLRLNSWEKELLEYIYNINRSLMIGSRIKILHEGFASFVQDKYIMEVAKTDVKLAWKMRDFLLSIADVLSPPQLPYYLGFRLFKDIERRWNEGKHGPIYDLLSENEKRTYSNWEGKGLEEVLNVVKSSTDWELIFSYANMDFFKELIDEIKKKVDWLAQRDYGQYGETFVKMIEDSYNKNLDPDIMRFQLLLQTENYAPIVFIPKGSFNGSKLYLRQDLSFIKRYAMGIKDDSERELFNKQVNYIFNLNNELTYKSLIRISKLWGIQVLLDTMDENGKPIILSSDGQKVYKSEKANGPRME